MHVTLHHVSDVTLPMSHQCQKNNTYATCHMSVSHICPIDVTNYMCVVWHTSWHGTSRNLILKLWAQAGEDGSGNSLF